ncbi:hypothetical protein HK104_008521 [Borealophlyctis nickersoniae]|nr:hypothetical protein HK104_008521 [Borealophlyctis nickersoniae]
MAPINYAEKGYVKLPTTEDTLPTYAEKTQDAAGASQQGEPERRCPFKGRRPCFTVLRFLAILFAVGMTAHCLTHISTHKKGKKGGHHHSKKCEGTVISQNLPSDYEPSDLVWDKPSSTLYVASDNGRIAGIDVDGNVKGEWDLGKKFDLEGIALVPQKRGFVYAAHEHPPSIIEFNTASSKIERRWNISIPTPQYPFPGNYTAHKANGIESLVFIASRNSPNGGFFYAGRQSDARVFVFDVPVDKDVQPDEEGGKAIYRGYLDPPGPGYDLAAMTAFREILYFIYDKTKTVHALDLTNPRFIPPAAVSDDKEWQVDARKDDFTERDLKFLRRGQEGMTFAEVKGKVHESYVFIGIDPPKGKGEKEVLRFGLKEFWKCFEHPKEE